MAPLLPSCIFPVCLCCQTLQVLVHGEGPDVTPVKVLNCDTISQVRIFFYFQSYIFFWSLSSGLFDLWLSLKTKRSFAVSFPATLHFVLKTDRMSRIVWGSCKTSVCRYSAANKCEWDIIVCVLSWHYGRWICNFVLCRWKRRSSIRCTEICRILRDQRWRVLHWVRNKNNH